MEPDLSSRRYQPEALLQPFDLAPAFVVEGGCILRSVGAPDRCRWHVVIERSLSSTSGREVQSPPQASRRRRQPAAPARLVPGTATCRASRLGLT